MWTSTIGEVIGWVTTNMAPKLTGFTLMRTWFEILGCNLLGLVKILSFKKNRKMYFWGHSCWLSLRLNPNIWICIKIYVVFVLSPFSFILNLKCQEKVWLITNCYLINVYSVSQDNVILDHPLNFACIISRRWFISVN